MQFYDAQIQKHIQNYKETKYVEQERLATAYIKKLGIMRDRFDGSKEDDNDSLHTVYDYVVALDKRLSGLREWADGNIDLDDFILYPPPSLVLPLSIWTKSWSKGG